MIQRICDRCKKTMRDDEQSDVFVDGGGMVKRVELLFRVHFDAESEGLVAQKDICRHCYQRFMEWLEQ